MSDNKIDRFRVSYNEPFVLVRVSDLDKIESKLDCAVKALEFYGDPETYIETHNDCYIKIEPKNDEELIRHYQHKKKEGWIGTVVVGGKRARTFLEKIKK